MALLLPTPNLLLADLSAFDAAMSAVTDAMIDLRSALRRGEGADSVLRPERALAALAEAERIALALPAKVTTARQVLARVIDENARRGT